MQNKKLRIQDKKTNFHKKKIIIISMLLLIVLSFCILSVLNSKESPGLSGTWQSEETGQVIRFTNKGTVVLKDNSKTGVYRIISTNTMEYTIDDLTFTMTYRIEEGMLYWGIDEENIERFNRKSF